MGNEFDEHSSIHQHHHLFHQKTIFLPMFCKLSIKDIKLNRRRRHPTVSDEPSSPKVTCMGQVKRNNRVTALPAATHPHRYSKLKKLFSSKALLPPTAAGGRSGIKSCRSSREDISVNNVRRLKLKKDGDDVDVGRLDPPLPVVKKAAPPRDEASLWRRRFDGAALKTLQIQHIHLPNTISQPTTV